MFYTRFNTSICDIILIGDKKGLAFLHLCVDEGNNRAIESSSCVKNDIFFYDVKSQILEYLEGKRLKFNIKLNLQGTDFQKKVWKMLQTIPYGETRSYKNIAVLIGNKNATRAVANSIAKNPIALIIPCHRVIGSNGRLVGFAYGLKMKKELLELECK